MKPDCLNDRDLILLHYGEQPERMTLLAAAGHLAACPSCQERCAQLAADLARIPVAAEPDPLAAARVAARVSERLNRRPRWFPVAGAAAAGAIALAITVLVVAPDRQAPAPGDQPPLASLQAPNGNRPSPALDPELLEQLDLLEELETLRAIEGV